MPIQARFDISGKENGSRQWRGQLEATGVGEQMQDSWFFRLLKENLLDLEPPGRADIVVKHL